MPNRSSGRSPMSRTVTGFALCVSLLASLTGHAAAQGRGEDPAASGGPPSRVTAPGVAAWTLFPRGILPSGPRPRMGAYAVVDPLRGRMVVFGGWGFQYFDDTWTLDLASGTRWTQMTGALHPGPRLEYAS